MSQQNDLELSHVASEKRRAHRRMLVTQEVSDQRNLASQIWLDQEARQHDPAGASDLIGVALARPRAAPGS
jgi:hypothetical protein